MKSYLHFAILLDFCANFSSLLLFSFSWPSLQSLHRSRLGAEREAETAPDTNNFHVRAAERARASVPGDPLPRHLHSRGDRHENRPHRGEGSGKENSNYIHKYPRHRPQTSPSKNIFNCFVRGTKNSENWKILPHEVGAVSVEKCSLAEVGKFCPNLNWPDGASGLLLSSVFCWCWMSISGGSGNKYTTGELCNSRERFYGSEFFIFDFAKVPWKPF